MELLKLSKFKLHLRALIAEVRELKEREQSASEHLYVSIQKQKKTEEEFSRKIQELQGELASSQEFQHKLEKKVNCLQNDNVLLENKQKELKATIDTLLQSRETFLAHYEIKPYEQTIFLGFSFLVLRTDSGILSVDFIPDLNVEDAKSILLKHKSQFGKKQVLNSFPPEFDLVKRFWKYVLDREGLDGETLWASISNNSLISVASLLKQCLFAVKGKGQFKDEFVTAGGVPLPEVSLKTMESKIKPNLFFAGEVLNIDGVIGWIQLSECLVRWLYCWNAHW